MSRLKMALVLALVGVGLLGCVYKEVRGGPPGWYDHGGEYRYGWHDRRY